MAGVAVGTGIAAAGAGLVADHLSWRLVFVVTGLAAAALVGGAAAGCAEPAVRRRADDACSAPCARSCGTGRPGWCSPSPSRRASCCSAC